VRCAVYCVKVQVREEPAARFTYTWGPNEWTRVAVRGVWQGGADPRGALGRVLMM
jgi:hypothetical protein